MADEFGIAEDSEITSTTDTHEQSSEGVYATSEVASDAGTTLKSLRGDTSDEIDPRNLVRDPTLSEIRWYYRRTFAKTLVDKPIDDAFKNGFDFEGDRADEARSFIEEPTFNGDGDGFIGAYRLAEKKARRDGFALVFIGTQESGGDLAQSPIENADNVDEISHVKVLTIDDLTESSGPIDEIEESTGLSPTNYEIRETGIVVNTDPNSADYRTPVGYVLDNSPPKFIHKDRIIHLTWNPEVDGDYRGQGVRRYEDARHSTLGQYEGDSVLIPSYDIMKGIAKGNWAIMQAVFRNASHMYSVELPVDASDKDMTNAVRETRNINAKSTLVFPDGYEVTQHESGNELEPAEHYDVLFNQVCASHEMTKSVLFGTQTGTVSGSETDIKNYFNKVERFRSNRATKKIRSYLARAKKISDGRVADTFDEQQYDIDIEWGPLFKVDRETRVQMLQNESNALTTMIGSFAMTPDEARAVLSEDFTQIELGDMTEEQMDVLDRINLTRSGQGPAAIRSENEYTSGPGTGQSSAAASQGGQEGGMEQGQQTASENPAAAGDSSTEHDSTEQAADAITDAIEQAAGDVTVTIEQSDGDNE